MYPDSSEPTTQMSTLPPSGPPPGESMGQTVVESGRSKGISRALMAGLFVVLLGVGSAAAYSLSGSSSEDATDETPVPSSVAAADGDSENASLQSELDDSAVASGADGVAESSVWDLDLGDCWNGGGEVVLSNVQIVDCDQPHGLEVYWVHEMNDAEFPGQEEVISRADEVCVEAFGIALGVPYEESPLDYHSLYPTEVTWVKGGDRQVLCSVISAGAIESDAGGQEGEGSEGGEEGVVTNIFEVLEGDCFNLPGEGDVVFEVEVLDCDSLHDAEMYGVYELDWDEFPGQDEVDNKGWELCLEGFEAYINFDYYDSELDVYYLTPGPESWATGDKVVQCAAVSYAGTKLSGTVEGAAR